MLNFLLPQKHKPVMKFVVLTFMLLIPALLTATDREEILNRLKQRLGGQENEHGFTRRNLPPQGALTAALERLHPISNVDVLGQGLGSFTQLNLTDLNGDGISDMMYLRADMDAIEWVYYDTVHGYADVQRFDFVTFTESETSARYPKIGDLNLDGFPDVAYSTVDTNGEEVLRSRNWDPTTSNFGSATDLPLFPKARDLAVIEPSKELGYGARFLTLHLVEDETGVGFYDETGFSNYISLPATPVSGFALRDSSGFEHGILIFCHSPNTAWLMSSDGSSYTEVTDAFPELGLAKGSAVVQSAYPWSLIPGTGSAEVAIDFLVLDDTANPVVTSFYYGNGSGSVYDFTSVWLHTAPNLAQAIWKVPQDVDGNGINDLIYAKHNATTHAPEWYQTPFGSNTPATLTNTAMIGSALMINGGFLTGLGDLLLAAVDCWPKTIAKPEHKKIANKVINFLEDVCANMAAGATKTKCEKVAKSLDAAVNDPDCKKFFTPDLKANGGGALIETGELWIDLPLVGASCSLNDGTFIDLVGLMYHEGTHLGCKTRSETDATEATIDFMEALLDALNDDGTPKPGGILDGVTWRFNKQGPPDPNPLDGGGNTKSRIKRHKHIQKAYQVKHRDLVCALARAYCLGTGGGSDPIYTWMLELFNKSAGDSTPEDTFTDPTVSADGKCVTFKYSYCGFSSDMKGTK